MTFTVIIPARFASSRLPGKPLADINGKPMVVHVMERALESGAQRVIVATDHPDVESAVQQAGGEVCLTRADHNSGTERLAEVIERYGFTDDDIIVNVQGDEPLIPSVIIRQVAENLAASKAGMATLAVPIETSEEAFNPNAVKVVTDAEGYALYFSRATIPGTESVLLSLRKPLAITSCVISVSMLTVRVLCVVTSVGHRASWSKSSYWSNCVCCGTARKFTLRSPKLFLASAWIPQKI